MRLCCRPEPQAARSLQTRRPALIRGVNNVCRGRHSSGRGFLLATCAGPVRQSTVTPAGAGTPSGRSNWGMYANDVEYSPGRLHPDGGRCLDVRGLAAHGLRPTGARPVIIQKGFQPAVPDQPRDTSEFGDSSIRARRKTTSSKTSSSPPRTTSSSRTGSRRRRSSSSLSSRIPTSSPRCRPRGRTARRRSSGRASRPRPTSSSTASRTTARSTTRTTTARRRSASSRRPKRPATRGCSAS